MATSACSLSVLLTPLVSLIRFRPLRYLKPIWIGLAAAFGLTWLSLQIDLATAQQSGLQPGEAFVTHFSGVT